MILLSKLYDIISISTNLLLVIPTLLAVTMRNHRAAALAVGVTATALIGEALKTKVFWTQKRPRGAKDCDPLCQEGSCEHKPGMPSTHAAVTAFFTFWVAGSIKNVYFTTAATAYLLLVLLARYKKRCHSAAQLAAGSALGFGLAALFFAAGF